MICKHCGAEIPEWLDFCPECMKPVQADAAEAPAAAEPETAAAAVEEAPAAEHPAPEEAPARKAKAKKAEREPEAEVYHSPERPRKSRRRKSGRGGGGFLWFFVGLLCAAAVIAGLMLAGILRTDLKGAPTADTSAPVAERGFQKPENVLKFYAGAMKDGDLSGMLSTFSAETYLAHMPTADNYSPNFADGEDLMVWSVSPAELQAAGTPLSKAVAAETIRSNFLDLILAQFNYPLLHSSKYYAYNADGAMNLIDLKSEEELADFISWLPEAAPFSELTIGDVFEVSDKLSEDATAQYLDLMQQKATAYHADRAAFFYISLNIDGEDYLLGMELMQYDGNWYCSNMYTLGINIKDDYANDRNGGLLPVAAIDSWA